MPAVDFLDTKFTSQETNAAGKILKAWFSHARGVLAEALGAGVLISWSDPPGNRLLLGRASDCSTLKPKTDSITQSSTLRPSGAGQPLLWRNGLDTIYCTCIPAEKIADQL